MKSFQAIEPEYLDLKALSHYSCIGVSTLRGILSRPGGPAFFKLKGKILVNKTEWDRWLKQFKTAAVDLDSIVDEAIAGMKNK
jgi:hypothetical protein